MNDMVKEFLIESYENLDQLDRDLVTLEQDPHSQSTLASVFRTIHTIKGTCGFLGFGKLESLAHVGESLLCKLRERELLLDPDITSGLLAQVDAIRQMLESIEQIGNEGDTDYADLRERLVKLQQPRQPQQPAAVENAEPDVQPNVAAASTLPGDATIEAGHSNPKNVAAVAAPVDGDSRSAGEVLVERGEAHAEQVHEVLKTQQEARLSEGCIRVDVSLLEKLMNRVGELVLARNQILQYTSASEDTTFLNTCQRLNLITTELQEGVMKTRMQPIDTIWSKFPRVVRDLALQCGKQVRVEMEGKETELDKTIVEAIKDPLTHLVRNSVDHGIESPEQRVAAGKPAEGRLHLRAFHEGGQVNIEITDDGGGLKLDRIKKKALDRGLITADQGSRMRDRELALLIFRPGFSTAEKVTNVSGRGVGMDVVKTNIEKIGGAVDIQSQPGRGTTIKIKIPLTLAIIPALVVSSGGDRYAIPQVSLLELVRLEGAQARQGIEQLHSAPVYRLRGQLLPLVYLNRELGLSEVPDAATQDDGIVNIVVLRADDRQFGLVVDAINDTEEIVVKPLGKQFKGVSIFAGATIMGDGNVALILDVLGVAQSATWSPRCGIATWARRSKTTNTPMAKAGCCWSWGSVRRDWRCRSRWWPVWRKSTVPRSNTPIVSRWSNIAARCCRSSEWPKCWDLPRLPRPTSRCKSSSIPRVDGAPVWWSIGSSTRCRPATKSNGAFAPRASLAPR